jgi:hypothetical protein
MATNQETGEARIGWDETPRYRAQFDLEPAALPRYLHENPFAFESSPRSYQYSAKKITAGEIIETTSWPHVSLIPLNESARRVHAFFTTQMKSRMQISPWKDGRLNLDNGMSGNLFVSLAPIKPERVDLRAGGR